jgi:hypothetical protein
MPNWEYVLREIGKEKDDPGGESAIDKVRKKYLMQLNAKVGRNVVAYYSGFLAKPTIEGVELTDEDKNGFMLAFHKMDRSKGLDLLLHAPGGNIAATVSLVDYLKQMFKNDIRAFVRQIAMSAGTMLACACKEIYMGTHSNLGPVDPTVQGIQAQAVLAEVEQAYTEIKADEYRKYVWTPILGRYTPSFIKSCEWAVERATDFVTESLNGNMFSALPAKEREKKVNGIVKELVDLAKNKGHDTHLHYADCEKIGLNVKRLEDDKVLQDLILTVHHCYMHTLSNTTALKIIENHSGRRMCKLQQEQLVVLQRPVQAPPPVQN